MEKLNAIRFGDASPLTDLLQTALLRAGFETEIDGIFGSDTRSAAVRFQATRGLAQDGVVGERTWSALMPYLTGYITHTLRRGDTLYKLALANKTPVAAIETANPGIAPDNLKIGEKLIIPLWFDIVATNIRVSPQSNDVFLRGIAVRYPFV
ncbi:MAG: peptidoglycan-binding protein, partial [Oscillospiraceae bacterium]|nr:peptidoglycan-binding protein [Oscillospiraceae bacterium]